MMFRATVLMVSTVSVFTLAAAAGAARAQSAPVTVAAVETEANNPDLGKAPMVRDLDAEMRRTGRVALPNLHSEGTSILVSASLTRPETRVRAVIAAPRPSALPRVSLRAVPNLDFQYGKTVAAAMDRCQFDVARELGVTPTQVAAGTVTFFWTIEPSGQVRDMSAVALSSTDPAVMECAKRVVISRALLNPVRTPLALEWTYAFPPLPVPQNVASQR